VKWKITSGERRLLRIFPKEIGNETLKKGRVGCRGYGGKRVERTLMSSTDNQEKNERGLPQIIIVS